MCQLTPIGCARVERRHATTGPTEDRLQLRNRRPRISRARRRNLAEPVCGSSHASCATRFPKLIPKRALVERMTVRANDESKIAAGADAQRFSEHWQDRQRHLGVGLFSLDRRDAIADMLAPELHCVAATKAGVQQHVEPHSLSRANRPVALVGVDLLFGPDWDARVFWPSWIGDAGSGVGLDELRICSPPKYPAHRFEKMPRLSGCCVSTVAAGDDRCSRDLREGLLTCRLDDVREYGFSLLPRRKR